MTEGVDNPHYEIVTLFDDIPIGNDRIITAKERVNDGYFRRALLENYDGRCCLTGLSVKPLLVASHIKPWKDADPVFERLTPENGLLLDALHDRAFDKGFITIDHDLRIIVSNRIPKEGPALDLLWKYNRRQIVVPGPHRPRKEFIEFHNDEVFQR